MVFWMMRCRSTIGIVIKWPYTLTETHRSKLASQERLWKRAQSRQLARIPSSSKRINFKDFIFHQGIVRKEKHLMEDAQPKTH